MKTDNKSREVIESTKNYLSNAARNNEKVFLSSESFSHATSPDAVSLLGDILKDFDVTVITVYRESLSRFISWYTQQIKYLGSVGLFGFEKFLQDRISEFMYLEDEYIFKYSRVFGFRNLKIIDYDGMIAAGKDIRYVFACHIMEFGCDNKKIYDQHINKASVNAGDEREITKNEIIDLLFAYFLSNGCDISDKSKEERPSNQSWPKVIDVDIKHNFRQDVNIYRWPAVQYKYLNESYFQDYSEQSIRYDERFRYLYNESILFGNRTANIEMAKSSNFKTIDRSFLLSNRIWKKEMNKFFRKNYKKYCKAE